jgi:hypothetical protein
MRFLTYVVSDIIDSLVFNYNDLQYKEVHQANMYERQENHKDRNIFRQYFNPTNKVHIQ